MKVCHGCKKTLSLTDFNKNRSRIDGLASTCRNCMRNYRQAHYQANRADCINKAGARKARAKVESIEHIKKYLMSNPCIDCGNSDLRVLEFDHVRGNKFHNVSLLLTEGYSWSTIKEEIKKCDVRCANCHRIVTQERAGLFRSKWSPGVVV